MNKKLRKRKINAIRKKATSSYQCNRNSAGWIDPNGKIYWIPKSNKGYVAPDYDHGEFIKQVLLKDVPGDPQDNYIEWLQEEGSKWLKVSNYKDFSIYSGFPNQKQFDSFGEMHIECLPKTGSGFMSPEDDIITFVINRGISMSNIKRNMHLLKVEDLPEYEKEFKISEHPKFESFRLRIKAWEFFKKYCPDLENKYYNKIMGVDEEDM